MKTKWIVFAVLFLLGIGLILKGNHEMLNYVVQDGQETYRDVWRAARQEIWGWYIVGLVLLVAAYVLTYIPAKKVK